jgi:hypothetical protein
MNSRCRVAAVIVVVAAGCGPRSVPSDDGGGTSASGTTTAADEGEGDSFGPADTLDFPASAGESASDGDLATVCVCTPQPDLGSSCLGEPRCELPMPCPPLTVTCPRAGTDLYDCGSEFVYDEVATTCVLEVLRDDMPAHLLVDGTEDWGIFTGQEQFELFVLGDRIVERTSCMATDVGGQGHAWLGASAGAEHFAGCLQLDVTRDRYECLFAGLTYTNQAPTCG